MVSRLSFRPNLGLIPVHVCSSVNLKLFTQQPCKGFSVRKHPVVYLFYARLRFLSTFIVTILIYLEAVFGQKNLHRVVEQKVWDEMKGNANQHKTKLQLI